MKRNWLEHADTWEEKLKAGVKDLWPQELMILRNCLNVSRKDRSYNDITDNNGKIFIM